ncbi:glycosyltransferase [Citromicrobium bathyomarinum]
MRALDALEGLDIVFFGDTAPYQGIKPAPLSAVRRFRPAPFKMIGSFIWQPEAVRQALSPKYDAMIFLGDQHQIGMWLGMIAARSTGKGVLLWSHGWIKRESAPRAFLRWLFHRLAHRVLVYSERGREGGIAQGFPADRIVTVFNSLDVAAADGIVARIENRALASVNPHTFFAAPEHPLLICVGRLTEKVRLDLLLDAAAQLGEDGRPVNVLLVGDGPVREELERQAQQQELNVHFYGECYDEEITGQLIYHSDIMVAPGKIGLTAMHSLMYGTPAITHSNLDRQMPEVEAIEPGRTGALFTFGDAEDLARTIAEWLDTPRTREDVRKMARAAIHDKWHPQTQAQIIANAIREVAR